MAVEANFPLLILLILLISAFMMPVIKNIRTVKLFSLSAMLLSLVLSVFTFKHVSRAGTFVYKVGHFAAPWGIELKIGYLESIMSIMFTFIAALIIWASFYSIEHEVKEKNIGLYYTLCGLLIASLLGIVYSNDIFNCFVFIEISSIAASGIVVVKDNKENIKAALKYLILSSLGSGLVLMGIAFLYSVTGNLNMDYIHQELVNVKDLYHNTLIISLGLFTVGLGVKSAMFPVHIWLPDAHTYAPSSSSAMLSALVLKAYIILFIKIVFRLYGIDIVNSMPVLDIVLVTGAAGMIYGSIMAILQKDLKRMIAYSSVAQIGYIFFGMGLGNFLGFVAAVFHIISHALTKSALFLIAGNIIHQTHSKEIGSLKGIGIEMPVTMGVFIAGALSMVGIPLFIGFNSKWNFALAIIDSNKILFIAVLVASSVLNAVYYLPIIINGFFGEENIKDKVFRSKEKPVQVLLPELILAFAIVYFGISSKGIIDLITKSIAGL
ncbi:MAG TPA: proton-conducting transporter membrane subunit [Bacillota bacterium]|nr:proton-conducting transporter membrane subunit [Bacillota bacterium]HPW39952.1 proton-conducting transporter membrane subunit [Bacillota bacterium]